MPRTRKRTPAETEKQILLKSRRRCCLCFWLDGTNVVQKGQIAHLDQNNQNAQEENLVFLCFNHHDEYDGTTRIAKGLQESEVRTWRDELYKQMEHEFGSEVEQVIQTLRQTHVTINSNAISVAEILLKLQTSFAMGPFGPDIQGFLKESYDRLS